MITLLVYVGFPLEQILKMGGAEFNYFFIQSFILIKRQLQITSVALAGTIGSFFVEKGKKTIFDVLTTEIEEVRGLLYPKETSKITEITPSWKKEEIKKTMVAKGRKAVAKLFGQLKGKQGFK